MTKVTSKNTKDQILEAYNTAQEEIKRLKEGKTTTAEIVKAKEIKEVKENAKEIIDLGILNDDVKDKYTALLKTVDLLEKEIEELYSIKKEADSLEALINANKDKDRELDIKYAAKVNEINDDLIAKKTEVDKKTKEMNADFEKIKTTLQADFQEEKAKLVKERAREKEEFEYKLKRDRAIEDDKWEDEKAARERALAERELVVAEKEAAVDELNITVESLKALLVTMETENKEKVDAAFKDGKDKAGREYGIQKSMIEKEANWNKEKLEEKVKSLEEALESEKVAHKVTAGKLDAAYVQIQDIATKTVQASGSVRIVESSKN